MAYLLPALPFAFDALEPHIDAATMEIHHGKHHAAYIAKVNAAIEGTPYAETPAEKLITMIQSLPQAMQGPVRNHGGGHCNHTLFWTVLSPKGGGEPSGALATAIKKAFGSFEAFQKAFSDAAGSRFGSGWAWLTVSSGQLSVASTANQDSPLMGKAIAGCAGTPILGLDVWEHAYYLQYQNKRPDYIAAFWKIINWDEVERRFLDCR